MNDGRIFCRDTGKILPPSRILLSSKTCHTRAAKPLHADQTLLPPPSWILAGVRNTTAKNRNVVTGSQNLDILIPLHYDRKE